MLSFLVTSSLTARKFYYSQYMLQYGASGTYLLV
jgi:hypothetical protein